MKKIVIATLAAIILTGCFDKTETTEQANANTTTKIVKEVTASSSKADDQASMLEQAKVEYLKFDQFKNELEQGLGGYQERLMRLNKSELSQDDAEKLVKDIRNFMNESRQKLEGFDAKTEAVKQLRHLTLETLSLTVNVLTDSAAFVGNDVPTDNIQPVMKRLEENASKLTLSAQKLEALNERIKTDLNIK